MHKTVHVWQNWDGRPSGSTGSESSALCLFGSTVPVDRVAPTVTFLTVGGRPGRPTGSLSGCQLSLTASFCFGLYKPQLFGILAKVFTREKFPVSLSLKQVFQKSFCALNFQSLLFWVFGKSKKTRFWDIDLIFHFLSFTRDFPISFSLLLVSKNT